jgi:hypothetical protein
MIVAKGMGMGQSCKFNQRTAVFLQAPTPTIITAAAGRDEEVQLGLGLTDSSTSILYRSVLNGAMTWVGEWRRAWGRAATLNQCCSHVVL